MNPEGNVHPRLSGRGVRHMPAAKPRIGATLRKERKARLMPVRAMAEALRNAAPDEHERESLPRLVDLMRMIRNWEANVYGVSERYQMLFCRVFDITQEQLLSNEAPRSESGLGTSLGEADTPGDDEGSRAREEDEMERRQMLQALAALGGASLSPLTEALQTIRTCVEASLGRDVSAQLDDWEATVAEHGYSYLAVPPQQLIGELAADLVSVQSIRPRINEGHPQYTRWCRITGGLAALVAKTLCNLGQARDARTWWSTAQHAADASRDLDLSLWVGGERLMHGLYGRRPIPVLLHEAKTIISQTPTRPCAGLAHVRTLQAQLLAQTGQAGQAAAEIRRAEEVFVQLPAEVTQDVGSIMCWGEDRLRYTEAWVHAYSGSPEQLDVATTKALQLYEHADPRSATQIKLLQAFGHIRAGDITEGVKHASSTYEACTTEQRTTIVARLADQVWDAVPAKQRTIPAAAAYRELLAVPSSRKALT